MYDLESVSRRLDELIAAVDCGTTQLDRIAKALEKSVEIAKKTLDRINEIK